MHQAESACTTRRALFAGALALSAAPAIAKAQPPDPSEAWWDELERTMSWAHPNGLRAARHARAAGVNPKDLSLISLEALVDADPDMLPILMFRKEGGRGFRAFRPCGEDAN